jgi:hypothetical protein
MKKMGKQSVNKGWVFLLIFLVAIGIFLLYTKLSFTGLVTNIPGGSVSSYSLSEGTFSGTKVDSSTPSSIVLDLSNNYTNGTYISPFISVPSGIEVVWNNFAPNTTIPQGSIVTYLSRVCADTNCSEGFSPIGTNLAGKYFQYKVYMEAAVITTYTNVTNATTNETTTISTTTTTSPIFYGADMTYLIPIALSISIDSPQNTTSNNESVLIKISTTNASSVWFSSDGGSNEVYTGEVHRTFSQGAHSITVYANDTQHVISKTVSFAVLLPEPYCGDGVCNGAEVCANCHQDCGACNNEEDDSESTTDLSDSVCTPGWECTAWSECADGTQTRVCDDVNDCGLAEGMPDGTQSCVVVAAAESEETNTETSTTTKKGFFGTVGSVITAPVTFVFGNKTRIFIFFGVLVLAVAGFFGYRFFSAGKKLNLKFLLNKLSFGKFHGFDNMLE